MGITKDGKDYSPDEALQRLIQGGVLATLPRMKRVSAAALTLVAGKPGRDMRAPEPLVQVGFEPDPDEMGILVATACSNQRDLIHIGCHRDGVGGPTGMIAVIWFEEGRPMPHRRCNLVCQPGTSKVVLAGVADDTDEQCHFGFVPGRKMNRHPGWIAGDLGACLNRAGEFWIRLSQSAELADASDELLGLYALT